MESSRRLDVPMVALFDEFAQPGVTFELLSRAAEGDVANFVWRARTQDRVRLLR